MYFCVLLRVYRLVFITVLMYNPLWKIVMGPYAACKGGVNCFIKKKLGKKFKKKIPRPRGRAARARSRALAPSAVAPREQIANLSHFDQ